MVMVWPGAGTLPTPGRMSPHFSPEAEVVSSTSLAFSAAWAAGGAAQVAAAAACVESAAGVAGQPEHSCRLAEAGRR